VAVALLAQDGQDGAGDVHGAVEVGLDLPVQVLRGELLEEASVEVPGVVDQDVDAAEAVDGGLGGRVGVVQAGDVKLGGQQVVLRAAQGLLDLLGAAPGPFAL